MIEESYGYEDDLINGVYVAYENIFVAESNSPIKYIECDNTGKLLAFVEYDGTISIWDYSNEEWKRQATWKYRGPRKPNYKPPKLNQQEPLVSTYRTDVIARWCGHGRYLGIASNVSRKVHLFGENSRFMRFL
jgi:WD40 repeat protein